MTAYLRERSDVDVMRLAWWGDSFTSTNSIDTDYNVPRCVDGWPQSPEPLGGLLALRGGLFEHDIRVVYVAGGLIDDHGVLTHFEVLIPHSASIPGALTAGEIADIAGGLAPRPLRLEALVDHLNRPISAAEMRKAYGPTVANYSATPQAFSTSESRSFAAVWLLDQLR